LASLFNSGVADSPTSNESLKYKAPKQPQPQPQPQQQQQQQPSSSSAIMFFSSVQAFKFINNQYEAQNKLGLALLSTSPSNYTLLLYIDRTRPMASIKIGNDFKVAIQNNNYASIYDDTKQLWSILFDSEKLIIQFSTQILLCKCNLLNGQLRNVILQQDLNALPPQSTIDDQIEMGDSVELATILTEWKDSDMRLYNEIENTTAKPLRLRLGKNKLPKCIENLICEMRQGQRRLFALNSQLLQGFYSNEQLTSSPVIFYDINIIRIKKNKQQQQQQQQQPIIDQQNIEDDNTDTETTTSSIRTRSNSNVKELTKSLNESMGATKQYQQQQQQQQQQQSDKANLLSRMAKMGQPLLTNTNNINTTLDNQNQRIQNEDYYQETAPSPSPSPSISNSNSNQIQQQLLQNMLQQQFQQQQHQQQFILPNQFMGQMSPMGQMGPIENNQLALFKSPMQFYQQQQQPQQKEPTPPPPPPQQQSISTKLDDESLIEKKFATVNDKLDDIKANLTSMSRETRDKMPSLETNILLQNITRIVKENESTKQELFEKSVKIEELNRRITELLAKAQSYVEESQERLEKKNVTFQSTAEKTALRCLQLEEDKMRLTDQLTTLTARVTQLNIQINNGQKEQADLEQKLLEVSQNTDAHKQTIDRLKLDNADLQTKLDSSLNDFKQEKTLRKTVQLKFQQQDEEILELRSQLTQQVKLNEERKKKYEEEKMNNDQDVEEQRKITTAQIQALKERLKRYRDNAEEAEREQIATIEEDLKIEWQKRLDKAIKTSEDRAERKITEIIEEKVKAQRQLADAQSIIQQLREQITTNETENSQLVKTIDEITVFKGKYERLQKQAIALKDRYEQRIRELLEAEPEAEVIAEEVKKLMNVIYKKLKAQIKTDENYSGNGILNGMLRIIKLVTLQLLNAQNDNDNNNNDEIDNVNFFDAYITKTIDNNLNFASITTTTTTTTPSNEDTTKSTDQGRTFSQSRSMIEDGIQLIETTTVVETSTSTAEEVLASEAPSEASKEALISENKVEVASPNEALKEALISENEVEEAASSEALKEALISENKVEEAPSSEAPIEAPIEAPSEAPSEAPIEASKQVLIDENKDKEDGPVESINNTISTETKTEMEASIESDDSKTVHIEKEDHEEGN
jgi:FK506-binding protein 15